MRSDKIVTLYAPRGKNVAVINVQQLLRAASKRLEMPGREAFTMKLVNDSGEIVNGNTYVENLGRETLETDYEKYIEKEIENLDNNIEGSLWQHWANYNGEDEEEFLRIVSKAWTRVFLRKMGRVKFRRILKDEGI